jgi:glycosyltransferase involved in cell wall biosynthesis
MDNQFLSNLSNRSVVMITRQFCDISYGGVEVHILNVARQYVRLGVKVKVIRIGNIPSPSPFNDEFEFQFVKFGKSKGQSQGKKGTSGLLGELLDRLLMNAYTNAQYKDLLLAIGDVEIVHFHDLLAINRIARDLTKLRRVVWTNHLAEFLKISRIPLGATILKYLTKPFLLAFAPSAELANQNCIACPAYLVSNGFDIELFDLPESRQEYKVKLGLPVNKKVYLVPRRWAPTKGVGNLVKALKNYQNNDLIFVFLGFDHGSYSNYYESVLDDLREWKIEYLLKESVVAADMPDWYRASEFTVIPSLEEATSLAALEAMGSGSLVVCTPVGGLLELVEHGVTGLFSTETSSQSLKQVIVESTLLTPTDHKKIISTARSFAENNYSWGTIAKLNLNLLNKIYNNEQFVKEVYKHKDETAKD